MNQLNAATVAAREIVSTLISNGVRDVVLSPGSRSAPLAFALADAHHSGAMHLRVVADERSAAFIALGMSKASGVPAAVITTSGTAVANLHPAILEASHARIPLIAITADRPHHMRGVGANQTTDQAGIFGAAVRAQADIPAAEPVGNHMRRLIAMAEASLGGAPGPVHLNIALTDPLPPPEPWEVPPHLAHGSQPAPLSPPASLSQAAQVMTAASIDESLPPVVVSAQDRGVVVAGDQAGWQAHEAAEQLGWPILAEPSSGVRHSPYAVANYHRQLFHLSDQITDVLVFGRPTLTRDISRLLSRTDVRIQVVSPDPFWPDVAGVAEQVGARVVVESASAASPSWVQKWHAPAGEPPEWGMAAALWQMMAAPVPLFIGSSLPIRAADTYGPVGEQVKAPQIWANRGLAGIDGNIATATGLALKTGAVRAALGDVTFTHDAMSLARGVHEAEVDLQVVVLDNAGGKIFRTLEYGAPEFHSYLPQIFDTAQQLNIADFAQAVGAQYQQAQNAQEFAAALAQPIRGRSIIHAVLPQ